MSLRSNNSSSSFKPPALGHEMLTPPSTRPPSWLEESRYVFENEFPSSFSSSPTLQSSRGPASSASSLSPLSSPGGGQLNDDDKYDDRPLDPWARVPDGVEPTQEEMQWRWDRLNSRERANFKAMVVRSAELREFVREEAEVVLTTTGEEMYVKKIPESNPFKNWKWSWEVASSKRQKDAAKEKPATGPHDEGEVYDEDEENQENEGNDVDNADNDNEEDVDVDEPTAFAASRDSIDVQREWDIRRSYAEEYYRREYPAVEGSSIAQGLRHVGHKLFSAVQSRRVSPQSSSKQSPDNSDGETEEGDEVQERLAKSTSRLRLIMRRFSPPARQHQQQQQRRRRQWRREKEMMAKHEPCHRSRSPTAPVLKNADEFRPAAPAWSDRIGPKDELLDNLLPYGCLPGTANSDNGGAGLLHAESRHYNNPGLWLSGRC
ncbi:hypothetical protein PG995_002553 [Apiospora arundinis]